MTALLSILVLVAAWALLANVERLQWPPQRDNAIHDEAYWRAVQRDSEAYLATHANVSESVRTEVLRTITTAQRKLA